MAITERPDIEPSEWDMSTFEEKVDCPVVIVDEFEELPGNSDHWHLDSSTAMEIGEDDPCVQEGARGVQSVRVGGEGQGVKWATWGCSLSPRQLERNRQVYEREWDSLENLSLEWTIARELSYLYSMVVHDKGWKPHSADVDDYDIRIEVKPSESRISVRFVFEEVES